MFRSITHLTELIKTDISLGNVCKSITSNKGNTSPCVGFKANSRYFGISSHGGGVVMKAICEKKVMVQTILITTGLADIYHIHKTHPNKGWFQNVDVWH